MSTMIADSTALFRHQDNSHRPHRALQQDPPAGRPHPPTMAANVRVLRRDRPGGLIHEYSQVAEGDAVFGTHRAGHVRPSVRCARPPRTASTSGVTRRHVRPPAACHQRHGTTACRPPATRRPLLRHRRSTARARSPPGTAAALPAAPPAAGRGPHRQPTRRIQSAPPLLSHHNSSSSRCCDGRVQGVATTG
jgi:hypothetical protein